MKKIIAQGAEAILYRDNNKVIKDRVEKSYRIKEIDAPLRKRRTKLEARLLAEASKVISVPKVLKQEKNILTFEFINGDKVRDWLDSKHTKSEIQKVCKQIGKSLGKLHDNNIIHGDLTTSNLIKKENKVYFIDFGLGNRSQRIEAKAVDLHLFKECLISKHYEIWELCWKYFLQGYAPVNQKEILKQLEKVELRGRYRAGHI